MGLRKPFINNSIFPSLASPAGFGIIIIILKTWLMYSMITLFIDMDKKIVDGTSGGTCAVS